MKSKTNYLIMLLLCLLAFISVDCNKQSSNVKNSTEIRPSAEIDTYSPSDEAEKAASPFLEKPASHAKK